MKAAIVILVLCMAMGGCAPQKWCNSSKTFQNFEADKVDCIWKARLAGGGNSFMMMDAFKMCMRGQGYYLCK